MSSLEENRCKVIVIVEWVLFSLAATAVIIIGLLFSEQIGHLLSSDHPDGRAMFTKLFLIIALVSLSLSLLLNIILTKGIQGRNTCCCKTWYIVNIIYIVFYFLDLALAIITLNILSAFVTGGVLVYRIYAVRTIMSFVKVLQEGNGNGGGVVYNVPPNNTGNPIDLPPRYEVKHGQMV